MKMYSKLMRVPVKDKSAYRTTTLDSEQSPSLDSESNIYDRLISPWRQEISSSNNRFYFYNPETDESVWELPANVQEKVDKFFELEACRESQAGQTNVGRFVDEAKLRNSFDFRTSWRDRPAPTQQTASLVQDHAYKEGDREMNIWYDKTIQDEIIPQRPAAKTRCDPPLHVGKTFADTQRRPAFFCLHFARGACYKGSDCQFKHHMPELGECLEVPHARDVFGRTRFATQRKDSMGIGAFIDESRTLCVSDFAIKKIGEDLTAAYEQLYRHFGPWGDIEEMFLLPTSNVAYIRYKHRCMAEFAKEAMRDQALDGTEVLTIKWVPDSFSLETSEAKQLEDATLKLQPRKKKKTISQIESEQEVLVGKEMLGKREKDPRRVVIEADYNLAQLAWEREKNDLKRLERGMGGTVKNKFSLDNLLKDIQGS